MHVTTMHSNALAKHAFRNYCIVSDVALKRCDVAKKGATWRTSPSQHTTQESQLASRPLLIRSSLTSYSSNRQATDVIHISKLRATSIDSAITGIEPDHILEIARDRGESI